MPAAALQAPGRIASIRKTAQAQVKHETMPALRIAALLDPFMRIPLVQTTLLSEEVPVLSTAGDFEEVLGGPLHPGSTLSRKRW